MIESGAIAWAEAGMEIDPVNDGRHVLPADSMSRESIPYLAILPDEKIALTTYTWVNGAGEAGAALAIFGPGIADGPIEQRLPDRPVRPDMNFDAWELDDFSMRQDLDFDRAHVRWKADRAVLDFTFEALHPPYAYGSDPRGCPFYCATNRIEQAGRVTGSLQMGDRLIEFDTTGHRDHSWGTRDWTAFQQYEWFVGQAGRDVALHFWRLNALGREEVRGYVLKDGLMSRIVRVANRVCYDDQYWQTGFDALVVDEAGRETRVEGDIFGCYTLVPEPQCSLNESGAAIAIDGKPGVGWMECCWPTAYLDHIRAVPAYAGTGK